MSMFLTNDEIQELTNRKQRDAQRSMLNHLRISYKVRADGSLAILRSHVVKQFGDSDVSNKNRNSEPDWKAAHA